MRRAAASAARKLEPGTIRIAGFLGALLLLFGALTSFPAKGTETPPPATGSAEVPESLKRAGWRLLEVPGKAKAEFHDAYADAIRLKAENAVAFLYRPVDSESKLSGRLSWRWRVDQAVPPTDLSRPIGDDRTLAVHIVFPMIILLIYIAIFVAAFFAVKLVTSHLTKATDFTSLKTVTFGDESTVSADRAASVISVIAIFLIWGAFTGSKWSPIHAPGPFVGEAVFTYTAEAPDGSRDDGTVTVNVFEVGADSAAPDVEPGDGFAKNDAAKVGAWRSTLIRVDKNDDFDKKAGAKVVAIDGQPIAPGETVEVESGVVTLTPKGTPNYKPYQGWQMEPVWLPPPEAVVGRVFEIFSNGYQNFTLAEHVGWSLFRVVAGFVAGALIGIPLGYAMN